MANTILSVEALLNSARTQVPKTLGLTAGIAWVQGYLANQLASMQTMIDTSEATVAVTVPGRRNRARSRTRKTTTTTTTTATPRATRSRTRTSSRGRVRPSEAAAAANRVYNALPATGMIERSAIKFGRGPALPTERINSAIETLTNEGRVVISGSQVGRSIQQAAA
jgi:hypothetical protein